MVLNATLNNIAVISLLSILLVVKTGVSLAMSRVRTNN
jgi:hypothetical protein